MTDYTVRKAAILLRKEGKTYTQIQDILKMNIAKGTLSYWFRGLVISDSYHKLRKENQAKHLIEIRKTALHAKKQIRQRYINAIEHSNSNLADVPFQSTANAKVALALLYAAEGTKRTALGRAEVVFGNSDIHIIELFLKLLRFCYSIDEKKLRCTVQCRADQDTIKLCDFWSKNTQIPKSQFYKAQVDKRTVGKPTRKLDYHGVCRIEYLSADVFWDVLIAGEIITGARSLAVKRLHGMQETGGSIPPESTQ